MELISNVLTWVYLEFKSQVNWFGVLHMKGDFIVDGPLDVDDVRVQRMVIRI